MPPVRLTREEVERYSPDTLAFLEYRSPRDQQIVEGLASMAALSVRNAQMRDQLYRSHLDTIMRLSTAAEFRDQETSQHIQRVSLYCETIARYIVLLGGDDGVTSEGPFETGEARAERLLKRYAGDCDEGDQIDPSDEDVYYLDLFAGGSFNLDAMDEETARANLEAA